VLDSDYAFFLHIAVDTLVLSVVALAWAAPHIERAFGRGGGRWRDLAKKFATARPMPVGAVARQTAMIGPVLYRHCMSVGADETGLWLAPGPPMSIFLKQRLLIPWGEIARIEPATPFWGKAKTLIVGAPAVATVTLEARLFDKLARPWLPALDQSPKVGWGAKDRAT
jgi:hypothetical protein